MEHTLASTTTPAAAAALLVRGPLCLMTCKSKSPTRVYAQPELEQLSLSVNKDAFPQRQLEQLRLLDWFILISTQHKAGGSTKGWLTGPLGHC